MAGQWPFHSWCHGPYCKFLRTAHMLPPHPSNSPSSEELQELNPDDLLSPSLQWVHPPPHWNTGPGASGKSAGGVHAAPRSYKHHKSPDFNPAGQNWWLNALKHVRACVMENCGAVLPWWWAPTAQEFVSCLLIACCHVAHGQTNIKNINPVSWGIL